MKIYQFYSDYNDEHDYKRIPKDILFDVQMSSLPIPEKYRSKELDLFITDFGPMPNDLPQFKSFQVWYSKKTNLWKTDFYWSDNINELKLIKEKYLDTFKQIEEWPSFVPQDPLRFLVQLHFVYYDDYITLREQYNTKFHSKPHGF